VTHHTTRDRLTPDEHVANLVRDGRLVDEGQALLVLSARNVLSNLRCVGYVRGRTTVPIGVVGERFNSARPLHILAAHASGCHAIEMWDVRQPVPDGVDWFISGVPVLWGDESEEDIFRRLVPESADHSHVWHIPRGNHPLATPQTQSHWSALHEVFISALAASREEAFEELQGYAQREGLRREDGMLHNVVGLDGEGNLLQIIAVGRLESLGRWLHRRGAVRALCLDNSGSSVVRYRPASTSSAPAPFVQLAAAPNHRPLGTAYLVVELGKPGFGIHDPGGVLL